MLVMYCVYGESGSSLLIESTNSMIMFKVGIYMYGKTYNALKSEV